MADNSTGLPVQTISGQFVQTKLVDSGGTNVAAVDASGRLSVSLTASSATVTVDTELPAAGALADATSNPSTSVVGSFEHSYNGTTWDRNRNTAGTDGNAALTTTGILDVGIGPGFARRFNPANLGTANNSAVTNDVNGSGTAAIEIGTATSGTFVIEATVDGTTWVAPLAYDVGGAAFVTGTSITPAVGKVYVISVNGMRQLRIRTNSTLGATVANVWTLSIGDAISIAGPTTLTGTSAVNLTQVGGSAIALGQAAMAASLPVVIASNQTNLPDNIIQWGSTNVLTGGVAGSVGIGGLQASGASLSGNPMRAGGAFNTTQPTVTNGQAVDLQATARGALIIATGVDTPAFNITQVGGSAITLGSKTSANSFPVVIASDQGAIAVGTSTAALADATANPTTSQLASDLMTFNGTTWDRTRNAAAFDGNGALTTTGLLLAGAGPGFSRRFNPSNLGTAANSTSAVDVNGASTIMTEVNTGTSGTFTIEATVDATTWIAVLTYELSSGVFVTGVSNNAVAGKVYVSQVSGYRQYRLRTVSTLGATMAHQITLSLGDTMQILPQLSAPAALADATANPSVGGSQVFLMGYNGATWDRLKSSTTNGLVVDTELAATAALADGVANPTITTISAYGQIYNGSTWDRARGAVTLADALANPGVGLAQGQNFLMGYNGSTWDRVRTANTGRLQVDVVTGANNAPSGPVFSTQTSAALGAGSNATLNLFVTSGKTGQLYGVDVASTVPLKIEIQTILTGTGTTRVVLFAPSYAGVQWRAPYQTFITRASADGTTGFGVKITNKDASVAADIYATGYWNEV